MPVLGARFFGDAGRDLHVLWGQMTRPLVDDIMVQDVAGPEVTATVHEAAHPGDFAFEFRPTFRAARVTRLLGDAYEGFGILIDINTGIVSFADPAPPTNMRRNFIIEFLITNNVGGAASIEPLPLRVHVHRSLLSLRISPPRYRARLTAAGDQTFGKRFSLRALFDDDVVGDISNHPGVDWTAPGATSNIFSGNTIAIIAPAGAVQRVRAEWTHTAGSPPARAEAEIEVLRPWTDETLSERIDLVDGHPDTWAGTIRPEVVPNVLLVGAGFTIADASQFEGITNKIVHDLKRDTLTRPFDVLATSMNYWRIAPEAAARGGRRVLCEVHTRGEGASLAAYQTPPPNRVRRAGKWTLNNLIYHIGLPIRSETTGAGEKSRAALRAEWTAALPASGPALDVDDYIIDAWKALGTRQFIDNVDGFPLVQCGEPPSATDSSSTPLLLLGSEDDAELRAYLATLASRNGVALDGTDPQARLGRIWSEDDATWSFDNRSLVVMITASKGGRASRGTMIRVPIDGGEHGIPVTPVAAPARALTLAYTAEPPSSVDRDVWRTISHELGHSFGLGDEYVDFPSRDNSREPGLAHRGNLMSSEIRPAADHAIRPDDIKWNWLRARKAAVLAEDARLDGTSVIVPLRLEDANQFAEGDKVFLRTRRRYAALTGPLNTDDDATLMAGAITITAKQPFDLTIDGNIVLGSRLIGTGEVDAAEIARFVAGSVVLLAIEVVDPGVAATYGRYKRIIAPRVEAYMRDQRRPLSPEPIDAVLEAQESSRTHTPPGDTYPLFFSFKNTARIVGLYQGGNRFALGAYRPAGECMMRGSHSDHEFCHVCRYIMVDMIDPRQHWFIDRDYDEYYPE